MRNISKMLKCRAIFLHSIATMYGDYSIFNENFNELLDSFFDSYISSHFDKFDLIYHFRDKDGKIVIHEEEEWVSILNKYLNYCRINDTKNIIKLYNDVGFRDTQKISELTELFYDYVLLMANDNKLTLKN